MGVNDDWNPDRYESDHSYVYDYGEDVVDLLAPEEGERVLDLGCGTGRLTAEIADRGADATGVDSSEEMVGEARRNHPDPNFIVGDARGLEFEDEFDAVFSNAALHWIPEEDQDDIVASVGRALCDGGRFVAEMGGSGNIAQIRDATRDELTSRGYEYDDPWFFPSVGEYASVLEGNGFEVRRAVLFDRPTELGGEEDGLRSWLRMYAGSILSPVPEDEAEEVRSSVEERLRDGLYDEDESVWTADYRRLRFVAYRR